MLRITRYNDYVMRRRSYSRVSTIEKLMLMLMLDLPLRALNYVLFSSAYSVVRGFLCRKQTCTVTVCDTPLDGPH